MPRNLEPHALATVLRKFFAEHDAMHVGTEVSIPYLTLLTGIKLPKHTWERAFALLNRSGDLSQAINRQAYGGCGWERSSRYRILRTRRP